MKQVDRDSKHREITKQVYKEIQSRTKTGIDKEIKTRIKQVDNKIKTGR